MFEGLNHLDHGSVQVIGVTTGYISNVTKVRRSHLHVCKTRIYGGVRIQKVRTFINWNYELCLYIDFYYSGITYDTISECVLLRQSSTHILL